MFLKSDVNMARSRARKGAAVIEYMALILFILSALFIFQSYIQRGSFGQWKRAGDVFSYGRQYDPRPFGNLGDLGGTLECLCDTKTGLWVSTDCLDSMGCDCTLPPEDPEYAARCTNCLIDCSENKPAYRDCRDTNPGNECQCKDPASPQCVG